METDLLKQHWKSARADNINIILMNKYSSEMAEEAVKLCDKRIAEFPEDEEVEKEKV